MAIGSVFVGVLAKKYGRKWPLILFHLFPSLVRSNQPVEKLFKTHDRNANALISDQLGVHFIRSEFVVLVFCSGPTGACCFGDVHTWLFVSSGDF